MRYPRHFRGLGAGSLHDRAERSRSAHAATACSTRGEAGLDGVDDAHRDVILDRKDVLGLAVEALRPELEAAFDVGQLGGGDDGVNRVFLYWRYPQPEYRNTRPTPDPRPR
jgi:hypothetical protein